VLTPDQYPLTLNALTNACNQKSGRDPVMSIEKNIVQRIARDLGAKHLVQVEENFRSGVEKYKQRLCNTVFNDLQLDKPQFAIVCLLLLRGPQTPGELRARSGRLHAFADNGAVEDVLIGSGHSVLRYHGPRPAKQRTDFRRQKSADQCGLQWYRVV